MSDQFQSFETLAVEAKSRFANFLKRDPIGDVFLGILQRFSEMNHGKD